MAANNRKLYRDLRPGDEGVSIEIDAEDIEECKQAAELLHVAIRFHQGVEAANAVMRGAIVGKSQLKATKHYRLLKAAENAESVEKLSVELAELNKSLPHELKYGASASAIARQINRLRDRGGLPKRKKKQKKK